MTPSASTASTNKNFSGAADAVLKKYATQLTAALAVVVGVSGVMMFFHLYKGEVEALHEWLGMAFVAAVALHLARHRKPLAAMLGQYRMRILMAISALIAAAFIVATPAAPGNPVRMTIKAVLRAPIGELAPLLGVSTDQAIADLTAAGARNATPAQSLEALAQASNSEAFKLLATLVEHAESARQIEKD
jgi:hypothetical protein